MVILFNLLNAFEQVTQSWKCQLGDNIAFLLWRCYLADSFKHLLILTFTLCTQRSLRCPMCKYFHFILTGKTGFLNSQSGKSTLAAGHNELVQPLCERSEL